MSIRYTERRMVGGIDPAFRSEESEESQESEESEESEEEEKEHETTEHARRAVFAPGSG